jgi:hypothetical protein
MAFRTEAMTATGAAIFSSSNDQTVHRSAGQVFAAWPEAHHHTATRGSKQGNAGLYLAQNNAATDWESTTDALLLAGSWRW